MKNYNMHFLQQFGIKKQMFCHTFYHKIRYEKRKSNFPFMKMFDNHFFLTMKSYGNQFSHK